MVVVRLKRKRGRGEREREREREREMFKCTLTYRNKSGVYYCLSVIEMDSLIILRVKKGNPTFKRINLSLQLLLGSLEFLNFSLSSG